MNESPVYLDRIDGKMLYVPQGREPCAEIVDEHYVRYFTQIQTEFQDFPETGIGLTDTEVCRTGDHHSRITRNGKCIFAAIA
jgi:hypothetical protein